MTNLAHPRSDIRVSVAMATYNGETYLAEQIDSLFKQTRLPDEVVVFDDASTDGTLALLYRYALTAPFKMTVLNGAQNSGCNAAFQAALENCRGDILFFCDQDDIWLPRKIEACVAALEAAPDAGFVFCNAVQFDSTMGDLDQTLWQLARFSPSRQAAYRRRPFATMLTGGNFVYGMASAFRRERVMPFLPIDCDPAGMTHDTWFALHASAMGAAGVGLPETLVRYRRHPGQTSVVLNGESADRSRHEQKARLRCARTILALKAVRQNLAREALRQRLNLDEALSVLGRKIDFLEFRETLRRERRLSGALRGFVNRDYWTFGRGPASVLRDYRGIW